jgi:hypothetical protein
MESISTEKTRAPSLARRAAKGRPTTSELQGSTASIKDAAEDNQSADRLITVTVLPYARSPYVNILLYTPTCSRHLTIARGVQGMMDFTVPGGGSFSEDGTATAVDDGVTDETRDRGSMKRILAQKYKFENMSGI